MPRWRHALDDEVEELALLASGLIEVRPELNDAIQAALAECCNAVLDAAHPLDGEQAAERFARTVRRLWLTAVGDSVGQVYRSPTRGQETRLSSGPHDAFGYERDLQPAKLERRCQGFFPAPPRGWAADHILFSSGQAAMTGALLSLRGGVLGADTHPALIHRGSYFETRSLIEAHPALADLRVDGDMAAANVVIIEPVSCDGDFTRIDVDAALDAWSAEERPRVAIIDSTLLGQADGLNDVLSRFGAHKTAAVLRIMSGLKLLQAGLELANVGILSVYTPTTQATKTIGRRLRETRTLTGSGLRYGDLLALEAPCFLDPAYCRRYGEAVFDHNGRLARAVAQSNTRFAPVNHPALNVPPGQAPYCAFRLVDSDADYEELAHDLTHEASRRRLAFEQGGSFGFRGHRFEIVRPDTGDEPFLRVALGRRSGWSCEGIVALMRDVAAT